MVSGAVFLYQFQVRGRYPALAPVGKFDIPPAADLVKDEDTRTFVQDEQVLGRLRTGGTLDGRYRDSDDGSVRTVIGSLLRGGEAEAAEGEQERGDACEESGPAPGAAGSEQEQQHACKRNCKQNEEQGCPCIGREHISEFPYPSLKEELRDALDAVLDGSLRKLEVETSVGI